MRLPEEMVALLETGGVLVTANARAARAVRLQYNEEQRERRRQVWAAPRVLEYDAWLEEKWRELLLTGTEERILLGALQEHAVWSRIVTPPVREQSLLAPEGIASLSAGAYALLCDYGALKELDGAAWGDGESEAELFRRWARRFRAECAERRWLSHSELPRALQEAFRSGALAPAPLGKLGFDRLTPAQSELLACAAGQDDRADEFTWRCADPVPATLYAARDLAQEVTAAAEWIRSRLEAQPGMRIGIVAPDVAAVRTEVERSFRRLLSPENVAITAPAGSLPFEFSLGLPLAEVPLVRAALLTLRWLLEPIAGAECTSLLLSGSLLSGGDAGLSELLAVAEWEAGLRDRELLPLQVELSQFVRLSAHGAAARALQRRLHAAQLRLQKHPATAGYAAWSALARHLLADAGWRGPRGADSAAFQAYRAWERALDQLPSLDFLGGRISFGGFLQTLDRLAAESLFSAESLGAPVQIVGALESSGQAFDAVWFLGADDAQWPAAGRPHPLLPLWLQRQTGMPHAEPATDWELAHGITERLLASAPEVVFSFAETRDGSAARPSPLLRSLSARRIESMPRTRECALLESFEDDAAIPWPAERIAGGQEVLADQAACPFKAFARKRLRARELRGAPHGLSPQQRGVVLHDVLQLVWKEDTPEAPHLGSRTDLWNAEVEGRLRGLVERHTAAALEKFYRQSTASWERAYLNAEGERIVQLALEWLAYERGRVDFEVVHCEEKIGITVGELKLSIRADRIDKVAEKHLLIDYKTGKVSTAKWEGERPDEPQLPLYAVFGGIENVAGALLAQVRSEDVSFHGCVEDAERQLLPRVSQASKLVREPYTPAVRGEWERVLLELGRSFLAGEAFVDPKQRPQTCKYCGLVGLCRVTEMGAADEGDAIDEEETRE